MWKSHALIYSLVFSALAFFTLVRVLEVADVAYTQTIYRVTYPQIFPFYLTGGPLVDDLIIVALGTASTVILFYHSKISFALVGAFLATISYALFTSNTLAADALSLAIFPVISILFLTTRRKLRVQTRITKNSFILSLTIIFLALELLSLFNWLAYPAAPSRLYSSWQWYGADLQAKLTQVFAMLAPVMMVLLIFSYGIKPSFDLLRNLVAFRLKSVSATNYSKQRIRLELADGSYITPQQHNTAPIRYPRFTPWLFLLGSCLLVIGLSIYPYLPSINPDFQIVSVDASFYVNQITLMKNEGLFAENGPFGEMNDRSFSLVFFYAIAVVTNQSPAQVVAFLPAFLGILNVISIHFLMRHVTANSEHKSLLLIAPLFAALSHQFIVGIYGGFLSNMLALPFSFGSILFFLRYWESKRKWLSFTVFAILISLTLLIHVYTWIFFATTIIVAAIALTLIRDQNNNNEQKKKIKQLLPVLGVTIVVAASIMIAAYLLGQASGLDRIVNLAAGSLSEDYFAQRWFNINYIFKIYLGGFLANPLPLLLSLVWVYGTKFKENRFNIVLISSISISSVFFFIGDFVIQSRMFYNIPMQIPAAIVAANILDGRYFGSISFRSRLVIVGLITIFLVNYALMSLANFYLIDFSAPH